jgi:hypothetical protein
MPDDSVLRFSDFGSSVDVQNNVNVFQGKIAFPGLEASSLEIPRGLEVPNLTVTIAFDDLAYPQMTQVLRDIVILEKISVTVGYALNNERYDIFHGYISNSVYNQVSLTLELESVLSVLGRSKVFKTGTSCRWAVVGSPVCGLDLNTPNFTKYRQVTAVSADRSSFTIDNTVETNYLNLGGATFTIDNTEVVIDILGNQNNTVYVFERLPLFVTAGVGVKLTIGCNKSWARCKELGNASEFGGTPPSSNFLINNRNLLAGTKDYSAD